MALVYFEEQVTHVTCSDGLSRGHRVATWTVMKLCFETSLSPRLRLPDCSPDWPSPYTVLLQALG